MSKHSYISKSVSSCTLFLNILIWPFSISKDEGEISLNKTGGISVGISNADVKLFESGNNVRKDPSELFKMEYR